MAIYLVQAGDATHVIASDRVPEGRVIRYAETTPIRDEDGDRGIEWPALQFRA